MISECGTMQVPLDWADPCGETTPLFVRRIPAADPEQRIGAIFVNPGGPGAGGSGLAGFVYSWIGDDLRARFDVIGWDPRGTGNSAAIECDFDGDLLREGDVSPDDARELAGLRARQEAFATSCGQSAGPLLGHVSTAETVRDLEALREYLGDEQISYVGYSYGTLLGARYADRYPERVRAFILDGAVDPSLGFAEAIVEQAAGFELALDNFLEDCAADSGCAFHSGGDPFTAFDALMAGIDVMPLPTADPQVLLEPSDAEVGVIGSLYSPGVWPDLAEALDAARDGDGTLLSGLADGYSGNSIFDPYASIKCIDEPSPTPSDFEAIDVQIAAASPRIGRSLSYEYQFCAYWPVAPTGIIEPTEAAGAPPIVVVGTTGDPATPFVWSERLADQLESGVLVTYDGEGHTIVGQGSECVDTLMRSYLLDETPPPPGTSCGG